MCNHPGSKVNYRFWSRRSEMCWVLQLSFNTLAEDANAADLPVSHLAGGDSHKSCAFLFNVSGPCFGVKVSKGFPPVLLFMSPSFSAVRCPVTHRYGGTKGRTNSGCNFCFKAPQQNGIRQKPVFSWNHILTPSYVSIKNIQTFREFLWVYLSQTDDNCWEVKPQ